MNEQTRIPADEISFPKFVFNVAQNRTILIIAAVAILVQFGVFKYLYPYASYIHGDSFNYLNAAHDNLDINTYLIGYSKFLRLFSVFSKSDLLLTAFQYLFIQCNMLLLLFSIFYFFNPSRLLQRLLLCFMVFNPLFLHLGNLISSDGLFLGLSLLWFTLLIWILHRPSFKIIIWHSFALFLAFTVRYNAMIYPIIACMAFCIAKLTLKEKIAGISLAILFCGSFILYTMYQYKKLTGISQYSPFSGWQLTNNAIYAYRYINPTDRKPVPKKFEPFDNMVRQYFDSTRDTEKFPIEKLEASTVYMWSPGLMMMKYKNKVFKDDTAASELKQWSSMGPFYKTYGLYIIRQYPLHFIRRFMWPNLKKYYAPPIEFLQVYNTGRDWVTLGTKKWFNYKTQNVRIRMNSNRVYALDFYPILSGITNITILLSLIFYLVLKGWRYNHTVSKSAIIIGTSLWLLNAGFTIFASSAALRFQSFPILFSIILSCLLINWLWKVSKNQAFDSIKVKTIPSGVSLNTTN